MKKNRLIYILICLTIISCQKKSDFSKTLEEYYQIGVPNVDSDWDNEELALTIESLKNLKKTDSFPLPKLNSKKSSLLFEKIIPDVPLIKMDENINYELQSSKFESVQNSLINLLILYGVKENEQMYYSTELVEIEKRIVENATNITITSNKFTENKTNDLIETGKEKIQSGLVKILITSMESSKPNIKYNKQDKFELATTVAYNLEKVWGYLDKKHKDSLEESISQTIQYSDCENIKGLYSNLLQELERE
jgi:hypothetical protein